MSPQKSPLVAAILAACPQAEAQYAADSFRKPLRGGRPATLDCVLADMETVARHFRAKNGLVTIEDFRGAGLSTNGLVEEPTVAGMTPAFTALEIRAFGPMVFDQMKREAGERGRRALQAASLFLISAIGAASAVAGGAHLLGWA